MTDHALTQELLSDMIRVRRMEEKCAELYGQAKIRGFLHLYVRPGGGCGGIASSPCRG